MKSFVLFGALLLTLADYALAAPEPFTLVAATPQALTPTTLAVAQKAGTQSQTSPDKKTLAFRQQNIPLVAVNGLRPPSAVARARVDWDDTTCLDIAAIFVAGFLAWRHHHNTPRMDMDHAMHHEHA